MKNILALVSALILCLAAVSCTYNEKIVEPTKKEVKIITNQPPTSAKIVLESDTVLINGTVGITCTVEDPDTNENFTFEWGSFKATENSTDDNYEYDYWHNMGTIVKEGTDALWSPGMAEGKYVIFCSAQDKGGVSLFTTKIISAINGAGITALTDSLVYHTDGTHNMNNMIIIRMYNFTDKSLEIDVCPNPQILIEKYESNEWIEYCLTGGGCSADKDPIGYINPGVYYRSEEPVPIVPGIFRIKMKYDVVDNRKKDEYLYTTVFEVK